MSAYFLFDGGNYKVRQDDGRKRLALTEKEAFAIYYDHEIPGDTDNSIGAYLAAAKYPEIFSKLAIGDELFLALGPDEAIYRGLWMKSFGVVDGFTGMLEMVNIVDVHNDIVSGGDGTDVLRTTGSLPLVYDFGNGMNEALTDAIDLAEMYGGDYTDYFSSAAFQAVTFDPIVAGQGKSIYLRFTVTALGDLATINGSGDCCSTCGGGKYPTFQVGATYDRTCADKMPVQKFCNCAEDLSKVSSKAIGDVDPAPVVVVPDIIVE